MVLKTKLTFSSESKWRTPYGKFETQKLGIVPFVENLCAKGESQGTRLSTAHMRATHGVARSRK